MNSRTNSATRLPATSAALTSVLDHLLDLLMSPLIGLEHWRQQQQVSMQLAHLDTRTLRDAGISEAQRFIEVNKPF